MHIQFRNIPGRWVSGWRYKIHKTRFRYHFYRESHRDNYSVRFNPIWVKIIVYNYRWTTGYMWRYIVCRYGPLNGILFCKLISPKMLLRDAFSRSRLIDLVQIELYNRCLSDQRFLIWREIDHSRYIRGNGRQLRVSLHSTRTVHILRSKMGQYSDCLSFEYFPNIGQFMSKIHHDDSRYVR